jgi:DNA primase
VSAVGGVSRLSTPLRIVSHLVLFSLFLFGSRIQRATLAWESPLKGICLRRLPVVPVPTPQRGAVLIPQSFIQELLSRVDCVDVVGRCVQLRKAGANFVGLCPFHAEKSPSFTVSPTKQFYHCFGCGAHGSALGFMIGYAGLSFPEAVRELEQGVGLVVPQAQADSADALRRDPDLLELMAMLTRFYRQRLKDSPRAIDYLRRRGLAGETAARYGIGYAPDQWRGLEAAVPDYDAPGLITTGMVIESEGDDGRRKHFDRFRDRIMFPIRNLRGQVIGFGGRVIDRGEPKYMNSPETPLFSKGRELYGAFEARDAMRRANCVVVVEGYMDVVMLAQHGVGHAVATLGTATTADHLRTLLRMVDRVVFAFDGDAAGRKAAWRALEACLPMVADSKRLDFLFLPPEHDPDSYVRAQGPDGFERLLGGALPLSEFLLRELAGRVDMETPEGRARFLADARPLLLALPLAALRMQLVHRVAEAGRVSTAELQSFLQQGAAQAARRQPAQGAQSGYDGRVAESGSDDDSGPWGPPSSELGGPWRGGAGIGSGSDAGRRGIRVGALRGGWRRNGPGGRDGPSGAYPLRGQNRLPDLQRRVRLLSALHPALAHEAFVADFLPPDLLDWLAQLRELPSGASFAALCEGLRDQQPDVVTLLQRDAAVGRAVVIDMTFEDARSEFAGALDQLRDKAIKVEIEALIAQGTLSEDDLKRLRALQSRRIRA